MVRGARGAERSDEHARGTREAAGVVVEASRYLAAIESNSSAYDATSEPQGKVDCRWIRGQEITRVAGMTLTRARWYRQPTSRQASNVWPFGRDELLKMGPTKARAFLPQEEAHRDVHSGLAGNSMPRSAGPWAAKPSDIWITAAGAVAHQRVGAGHRAAWSRLTRICKAAADDVVRFSALILTTRRRRSIMLVGGS